KRIYILSGTTGAGKSTIAYTVVNKSERRGLLGASFFFSKDSEEVPNVKYFVSPIARRLAFSQSHIRPKIVQAIRNRRAYSAGSLSGEFQELVIEPLAALPSTSSPVLLVIDALDECLDGTT
ncbi:hypothetical protein M422DRAFT_150650, partial [Sphaerobolus stellatus SS14]